ncbi:MAG: (2Fe-2S) ferredoxin domain-containing protein [Synergistaceae bacterium]|nr:(2Fe-2S) ferredoxin domain-containing protein [Synergistaceae bacterium]
MFKTSSLAELRKIKESETGRKTRIIVGLETCGIAAGAQSVMGALMEELEKNAVRGVAVEAADCQDIREPFVKVLQENGAHATYGRVKPADVSRIVFDHVLNGRVVRELAVAGVY